MSELDHEKAIEALKTSEDIIQTLFECASDGLLVTRSNGHILLVNSKVEELFGYSRAELLDQPVEILLPLDLRQIHSQHRANYLVDPHPRAMGSGLDLKGRRKDGTEFHVDVSLSCLAKLQDELLVMSVIADIEPRRKTEKFLQESEEKYRSLFEQANDSIFIIDPTTHRFLDANENAIQRLGYTREELLQLTVKDIAAPQATSKVDSILQTLFETGHIIFEHVQQRKDGTKIPVEISSRIIELGDRTIIQSIARDISERKRAEEARQRELDSLQLLSGAPQASITAETFGILPLSKTSPDIFQILWQRYGQLLELALEERAYKTDHNISEKLREMGEQLGRLKAGPRDVVEIHTIALKDKGNNNVPHPKTQAFMEEGRLLVLELMGHLVSYYRNHLMGN